jgi:hypothetical protein
MKNKEMYTHFPSLQIIVPVQPGPGKSQLSLSSPHPSHTMGICFFLVGCTTPSDRITLLEAPGAGGPFITEAREGVQTPALVLEAPGASRPFIAEVREPVLAGFKIF